MGDMIGILKCLKGYHSHVEVDFSPFLFSREA